MGDTSNSNDFTVGNTEVGICEEVAPDQTRPSSMTVTRRDSLRYAGLGTATFGGLNPLQLNFDLTPRLQHVWFQVKPDGWAEFVAKFESDVSLLFKLPGVSKQKVERKASTGDFTLEFKSVGMNPVPNVPEKRLLKGQIINLASKDSIDGSTVFTVPSRTFDLKKVKPREIGTFITMTFPDGFTYELPPKGAIQTASREYTESNFLGSGDERPSVPFDGSPVDYSGNNRYLSLPKITHPANSDIAWMQRVAQLKYDLLKLPGSEHNLRDLYRPGWYGRRAEEKSYQVARHIGNKLGLAAIEQVLLYKAPRELTGPKDVADIAEALQPKIAVSEDSKQDNGILGGLIDGLVSLFTGADNDSESTSDLPEEFEQAGEVPLNTVWMNEAVQSDWSHPEVRSSGLSSLYMTTQFERGWNHMFASTIDESKIDSIRQVYIHTLAAQRDIAYRTRRNVLEAPSRPSDEYWENLYQHVVELCGEFNELADIQIGILQQTEN